MIKMILIVLESLKKYLVFGVKAPQVSRYRTENATLCMARLIKRQLFCYPNKWNEPPLLLDWCGSDLSHAYLPLVTVLRMSGLICCFCIYWSSSWICLMGEVDNWTKGLWPSSLSPPTSFGTPAIESMQLK